MSIDASRNDEKHNDELQGEGNYEAGRRYNQATEDFVKSGGVEKNAERTADISSAEKDELEKAESIGKQHIKEEDPAVRRDYSHTSRSSI